MEIRSDQNNKRAQSFNTEVLNAVSGITTEKEAFIRRLGTSFYYMNCRSLQGTINMLRVLTTSRNIDVIIVMKTWLSCQIDDSELKAYSLLRRDRSIGIHGGAAAFIKSSLSYETVADSMSWNEQIKILAFKIHRLRNTPLNIIAIHAPSSQYFNVDTILIEKLQEVMQTTNSLLIGDSSAHNAQWNE